MEYCYWKSCWRALFAVKWITKNYQDLPFVTSLVKYYILAKQYLKLFYSVVRSRKEGA